MTPTAPTPSGSTRCRWGRWTSFRPWETRAVVGSQRFLQRLWRNVVDEQTGDVRVVDEAPDDETRRLLHRTIDQVRKDYGGLSDNTAIARLIELNNHVVKAGVTQREVAEAMVLMVAPLAPHIAEELWSRLGHEQSLAFAAFPVADPALLTVASVTCVLQVAGKVRDRIEVPPDVPEDELREKALASEAVQRALEGRDVRTVIVRAPQPGQRRARIESGGPRPARRGRHRLHQLPAGGARRSGTASRSCRCRS